MFFYINLNLNLIYSVWNENWYLDKFNYVWIIILIMIENVIGVIMNDEIMIEEKLFGLNFLINWGIVFVVVFKDWWLFVVVFGK